MERKLKEDREGDSSLFWRWRSRFVFVGISVYLGDQQDIRSRALQVAGYASLAYFHHNGVSPRTVDELLNSNYIIKDKDGSVVLCELGLPADLETIRRVNLHFPDRAANYELRRGIVVSRDNGAELKCIDIDGDCPGDEDWAYLWFRVATGQDSGKPLLTKLLDNKPQKPEHARIFVPRTTHIGINFRLDQSANESRIGHRFLPRL